MPNLFKIGTHINYQRFCLRDFKQNTRIQNHYKSKRRTSPQLASEEIVFTKTVSVKEIEEQK